MTRSIITLLKALVWLVVVVLIGYYLGWIRIPIFEKSLTDLEKDCVAAAVHSDARWAGDVDDVVRREVARAVLRNARVYKRDICDVFGRGLTLTPPGYKRLVPGYFRSVMYVRNSLESTEASWKSDLQLVEEVMKEKGDKGCASHYLRKSRMSDWAAQSNKARAAMKSSMRSVGKAKNKDGKEVGDAEFFCSNQ